MKLSRPIRLFSFVALVAPATLLAQGSPMVPTLPNSFGVDTVSTFFAGDPAVAPGGSGTLALALAAAFEAGSAVAGEIGGSGQNSIARSDSQADAAEAARKLSAQDSKVVEIRPATQQ